MTALFNLGFRPFFAAAMLHAVLVMLAWLVVYAGLLPTPLATVTSSQWHAHEMIYGYTLAVIAGFLLTAIRNWTGLATPVGARLALLFAPWCLARLAQLAGMPLALAAFADLLFVALLFLACATPIVRARQWRQAAILSKLLLLAAGNALFYAGAAGLVADGVRIGLHGGFYLLIALILTMGRRVIPLFTERGVEPPVALRNFRVLDIASLVLLLGFWIAEVFLRHAVAAAVCAGGVALVNGVRLGLWHTGGIWRRPLLWTLHAAFAAIAAGFAVHALALPVGYPPSLALHVLAIGGVGLVTLSMMARVTLGHTGRSVHAAPRGFALAALLLLACLAVRTLLPLLLPAQYALSVMLAQLLWIAAFATLALGWLPMLGAPRIDGAPG